MTNKLKPQNIKRFALQLGVIVFLAAVDHIIKYFIERDLRPVSTANFIPGVLRLLYVQNTGAAFGSMSSMTSLLSLITGALLCALLVFLLIDKSGNKIYHIFIPIIIAGGIGNLADRIFKGYVVDYLDLLFMDFAVFNFADCLVTCGAFALIAYLFISLIKDSRKTKSKDKIQEDATTPVSE